MNIKFPNLQKLGVASIQDMLVFANLQYTTFVACKYFSVTT
jgi:hypothetical protein